MFRFVFSEEQIPILPPQCLTALSPAGASAASWEQVRYRDAEGAAFTELDLRELARSQAFAAIGV